VAEPDLGEAYKGAFSLTVQIKKLNDGRSVGCGIFEIISFPAPDGAKGVGDAEIEQTYALFMRVTEEFYRLGQNSAAMAELLWVAERTERQTFRSRVRVFCVVRKISAQSTSLQGEIKHLQDHFSLVCVAKQYKIEILDSDSTEFKNLLSKIDKDCLFSVIKAEKCAGNITSVYPYYFTDVIPASSTDNFSSIVAAMSKFENCCVSFQLFPTQFTPQEHVYLNEVTGELGKVSTGVYMPQGFYRDLAAQEPYSVLSYYQRHANSSLFLYNILIFGRRSECSDLAAKIISLLQSGKKRLMNSDFAYVDLSAEKVDMTSQYFYYPWNINNKVVYTYRNKEIFKRVPMAKVLFRLPHLVTSEEAAVFFRLPIHDKTMVALKINQVHLKSEQFDAAVVSEDNIKFGSLVSHHSSDIVIGCPENIFTKHALVVGTPGSGKTTFAFNLLLQFARRNIPFLAIEPTKAEYRGMIDAIPEIQIFTPGNNKVSPFILNPFIPPKDISIEQYIPSLASAFKAAFSMPSPLDIIFLRAIRACYSENGWKDYSKYGDADVNTFGLYEFILTFKRIIASSNYSAEVKGNLQSAGVFRLMNLLEQNSNIFDTIHTVPIEDMLRNSTILELNAIDNREQKALIMALLLISVGVYTRNNRSSDGILKNIILVDEAHVLLGGGVSSSPDGADAQGATIKSLQDMIAEIRSYGTGIIIADQSPTKVSREVIANTDIKVSFRLVQSAEKELIADSTNMDEVSSQQISRLKRGEAYVYFSLLENPQLLITEDVRKKERIRLSVPSDEITKRNAYWKNRRNLLKPFVECTFCEVCGNGCDFSLRARADYYANRMMSLYASKIKNARELKIYLLATGKILSKVMTNMNVRRQKHLVACTTIRFMRKMQMETAIYITKSDIKDILALGGGEIG
jgi:hypothetical protein